MWPFKKHRREQLALIFCEDRKIDEAPLPVEKAYMVDDEANEAYHLIHKLLLPFQGYDRLVALISERDAVPLAPFDGLLSDPERKKLANPKPIAKEELYKALGQIERDERKNMIASAVRFSILVVAVMFALVVLINALPNFKLPFTG